MYSPSRPPALSKNLPGELWQVGKTVTQGELEVVNPGYVFTTISSIQPGEGESLLQEPMHAYIHTATPSLPVRRSGAAWHVFYGSPPARGRRGCCPERGLSPASKRT